MVAQHSRSDITRKILPKINSTDHSTYTTLNWGAGDIRELTPDAEKLEQVFKYRKASRHFLKVSQILLSLIVAGVE